MNMMNKIEGLTCIAAGVCRKEYFFEIFEQSDGLFSLRMVRGEKIGLYKDLEYEDIGKRLLGTRDW